MGKLSPEDLDTFKKRATFSLLPHENDTRSIVIQLKKPIAINNKTILNIRLKGIYPKVSHSNEIARYSFGNGFLHALFNIPCADMIKSRREREASEYKAWGTLQFERLKKEVETALALGPRITDLLLGFGLFEGLEFNGQPIGFAVYGMERDNDLRISEYIPQYIKENGRLPQMQELAAHTGWLLRKAHRQFILESPHLGNYGILNAETARLMDFDNATRMASIPPEMRPAFIYLNLSRTINDYQMIHRYEEFYDGEPEEHLIPTTPLLPFFLWGYFGGDTNLPFVQSIADFARADQDPSSCERYFGRLPYFGDGWREGGTFTLVEPIIHLMSQKNDAEINLQDYAGQYPLFGQFYQAIRAVAASIK